ncbi:MAG: hypothetical protein HY744_00305 [Deltaproteobacteria bacterium]|nr:hypothetical protein [Deltaproteobacteria bacterium]
MRPSPKLLFLARSAPGVAVQLAGLWCATRPGWAEVRLLAGVILAAVGTPLVMAAIEPYVARLGRRDAWAMAALLGPLGSLVVAGLRPASGAGRVGARAPGRGRSRADRVAAVLVTGLVSIGLLWGATVWLAGPDGTVAAPADCRQNERLAYERLRSIARAQERYKARDWDGDGKKTYAAFHIHLWRSVDAAGRPVPVGLISRELGFAMARRFALDGYVYRSVHRREGLSPAATAAPSGAALDPEKEWAVAAVPADPQKTGTLAFLADSSGAIWALPNGSLDAAIYTRDPTSSGWIEIPSVARLAELQRTIAYPEATAAGR